MNKAIEKYRSVMADIDKFCKEHYGGGSKEELVDGVYELKSYRDQVCEILLQHGVNVEKFEAVIQEEVLNEHAFMGEDSILRIKTYIHWHWQSWTNFPDPETFSAAIAEAIE